MSLSQPTVARLEMLLTALPFSAARRVTGEESVDEYNASSQTFTRMEALMVKVTDSDGHVGWGEAFGHRSNPATWAALEEIVGPFHLGRAADPQAVRHEAEYAFHAFGRTGPVHYALSAVDTALWDLTAQRTGVPLRRLLDPQARDTIDCYASLVHYGEDPVEVAHHIGRAQQAGYRSFKLHESTAPAVIAARTQAGPEAALMTDVNCRWDEAGAAQALEDFAEADLLWLEEPVFPPDDTGVLTRLNAAHGRISAGENASGVHGMVEQMRAGAVSYAQPSVGKIGGISAMQEVFAAGRETGVAVVPHCFYYGPALNASAELIAALGQDVQLEVPFLQWPQRLHRLHGAGPTITLSEEPGLGFTPDEQVLADHLMRRAVVEAS
ncbi:mandelate racemase/muconate lactonizing enzyme family protein [Nesterenkonia sp. CL21]|uniref:mandelate racemase/muconate lactonizing enzyme family protein n=1 Tax=Nesterenkonia sp. CL21 TaxID=3064894 RepID=UPI00287B1450|nr:mandelate racemase/muconate lactonizing enzyme family protein [Nesterenkonia sp. CL21]MDS2172687.1 mandelate racemase/muconate lactonizing enzyme family protein [Nesterenkonia sp. CL21]